MGILRELARLVALLPDEQPAPPFAVAADRNLVVEENDSQRCELVLLEESGCTDSTGVALVVNTGSVMFCPANIRCTSGSSAGLSGASSIQNLMYLDPSMFKSVTTDLHLSPLFFP